MSQPFDRTCRGCGGPIRSCNSTGYCRINAACKQAGNAEYRNVNPERVAAWKSNDPKVNQDKRRARVAWVRSLKIGKSCVDCAWVCTEDNYPAFDWDHRPGEVKSFGIAQFGWSRGREVALAEIAKCDLRCKNCHAIITHQRREAS